jgi:hypothetical protein
MQSTLKPKNADDPHDVLEVAPGVVLAAPADDEISNLLRAAKRQHSDPRAREQPGFSAGPPVPPVDTTFRAAAVNNARAPGSGKSMGARAMRRFMGFMLAVCIGVAAAAWQADGDTAGQMIANWSPQRVLALLLPPQKPAQPAAPAADATDANAAAVQPLPQAAAEGAAPAAAPSSETTRSLQSMARDLASAGQQIEQLKASIEQLKASQEQMSRDIGKLSEAKASEAKVSETKPSEVRAPEQNLRPKVSAVSALPPRPAAAPARRPPPSFRPSQAAAPAMLPPAAAPYVPPRQPEALLPPAPAPVPIDPELTSVPRPPMPLHE